jgi:hypothetical protein
VRNVLALGRHCTVFIDMIAVLLFCSVHRKRLCDAFFFMLVRHICLRPVQGGWDITLICNDHDRVYRLPCGATLPVLPNDVAQRSQIPLACLESSGDARCAEIVRSACPVRHLKTIRLGGKSRYPSLVRKSAATCDVCLVCT